MDNRSSWTAPILPSYGTTRLKATAQQIWLYPPEQFYSGWLQIGPQLMNPPETGQASGDVWSRSVPTPPTLHTVGGASTATRPVQTSISAPRPTTAPARRFFPRPSTG